MVNKVLLPMGVFLSSVRISLYIKLVSIQHAPWFDSQLPGSIQQILSSLHQAPLQAVFSSAKLPEGGREVGMVCPQG